MLKKLLAAIRNRLSNKAEIHAGHEFIASARASMVEQNQLHASTWQLGKEMGWSADMSAGVIVFRFANGAIGTAHFQLIGIYDEIAASFSWGWALPSVSSALRKHANLAKRWGRKFKHPAFVSHAVKCGVDEVWDFAAVTNSLAGSKGVYRGHAGSTYIFLTLGDIHIETDATAPHWAAMAKVSDEQPNYPGS